jgi:hypothetical protein
MDWVRFTSDVFTARRSEATVEIIFEDRVGIDAVGLFDVRTEIFLPAE